MSKPPTPTSGKRGRPRAKITKTRQNISIDPPVLKAAQKMAFQDGLSLSGWIRQLIRERIETANAAK